jgi:hypothetical protein
MTSTVEISCGQFRCCLEVRIALPVFVFAGTLILVAHWVTGPLYVGSETDTTRQIDTCIPESLKTYKCTICFGCGSRDPRGLQRATIRVRVGADRITLKIQNHQYPPV